MKVGIILGTIRKTRKSVSVSELVMKVAKNRDDKNIDYEIVDLKDFNLPIFDEKTPPAASMERETKEGRAWSKKLNSLDAYIFINAEYNRSIPGSLKNATDYVSSELKGKTGAIVSYGVTGGHSSVDHLRLVLSRLGLHLVSNQPYFMLSDFDANSQLFSESKDAAVQKINWMLNAIVKLSEKLSWNFYIEFFKS